MAADVEAIWAALFARLQSAPSFVTRSRRRREWGLELLPALMVLDDAGDEVEVDSEDRARDGLPPLLRLRGEIAIVAQVEDDDEHPTTKLNALIREVRAALETKSDDLSATGAGRYWTDLDYPGLALAVGRVQKGVGSAAGQIAARMEIVMEVPP